MAENSDPYLSSTRLPFSGHERTLVIAIDIGTTYSGVSYSILDPGETPKVYGVTRFPAQEDKAGSSKIPSILYYDAEGKFQAAGAEVNDPIISETADEEEWTRVEWFKLHLQPKGSAPRSGAKIPRLPHGKTAIQVYGDFLAYIVACVKTFIQESHANGDSIWESEKHYVLSHPNGWAGTQQAKLREGAILAGLIPDTDAGRSRIKFVTEGEASLHACIQGGLTDDLLKREGSEFVIVDAGGGTLDISSYRVVGSSPLMLEEVAAPDCRFAGSVFVNRRATVLIRDKLKGSVKYGTREAVDHIVKAFDETTKRRFKSADEMSFIKFGSPSDKEPEFGIRLGQMKLTGEEMMSLFKPSCDAAVESVRDQISRSTGSVDAVFLVGGFGASPWLFRQLQERLSDLNIKVSRPDGQTSKAVADGALGFYLDRYVSARVARYSYGTEVSRRFVPIDPQHIKRSARKVRIPSGRVFLSGIFNTILPKNQRVSESQEFKLSLNDEWTYQGNNRRSVEILCYKGKLQAPGWLDEDSENFRPLCTVTADLSTLTMITRESTGPDGRKFWNVDYAIVVSFGLTEFEARLEWVENGETKRGPVTVVFDEEGSRIDSLSETVEGEEEDRDDMYTVVGGTEGGSTPRSAATEVPDIPRDPGHGLMHDTSTTRALSVTVASPYMEPQQMEEATVDASATEPPQTDATQPDTPVVEPSVARAAEEQAKTPVAETPVATPTAEPQTAEPPAAQTPTAQTPIAEIPAAGTPTPETPTTETSQDDTEHESPMVTPRENPESLPAEDSFTEQSVPDNWDDLDGSDSLTEGPLSHEGSPVGDAQTLPEAGQEASESSGSVASTPVEGSGAPPDAASSVPSVLPEIRSRSDLDDLPTIEEEAEPPEETIKPSNVEKSPPVEQPVDQSAKSPQPVESPVEPADSVKPVEPIEPAEPVKPAEPAETVEAATAQVEGGDKDDAGGKTDTDNKVKTDQKKGETDETTETAGVVEAAGAAETDEKVEAEVEAVKVDEKDIEVDKKDIEADKEEVEADKEVQVDEKAVEIDKVADSGEGEAVAKKGETGTKEGEADKKKAEATVEVEANKGEAAGTAETTGTAEGDDAKIEVGEKVDDVEKVEGGETVEAAGTVEATATVQTDEKVEDKEADVEDGEKVETPTTAEPPAQPQPVEELVNTDSTPKPVDTPDPAPATPTATSLKTPTSLKSDVTAELTPVDGEPSPITDLASSSGSDLFQSELPESPLPTANGNATTNEGIPAADQTFASPTNPGDESYFETPRHPSFQIDYDRSVFDSADTVALPRSPSGHSGELIDAASPWYQDSRHFDAATLATPYPLRPAPSSVAPTSVPLPARDMSSTVEEITHVADPDADMYDDLSSETSAEMTTGYLEHSDDDDDSDEEDGTILPDDFDAQTPATHLQPMYTPGPSTYTPGPSTYTPGPSTYTEPPQRPDAPEPMTPTNMQPTERSDSSYGSPRQSTSQSVPATPSWTVRIDSKPSLPDEDETVAAEDTETVHDYGTSTVRGGEDDDDIPSYLGVEIEEDDDDWEEVPSYARVGAGKVR